MVKDSVIGALILAGSVAGIVAYAWLLFWSAWSILAIQVTAFLFVAVILGVLAWIGYTLATVPSPKTVSNPNEQDDGKESQDPKDS